MILAFKPLRGTCSTNSSPSLALISCSGQSGLFLSPISLPGLRSCFSTSWIAGYFLRADWPGWVGGWACLRSVESSQTFLEPVVSSPERMHRRSLRERKAPAPSRALVSADGDEEEQPSEAAEGRLQQSASSPDSGESDDDASEEEWRPEEKKSATKRRNARLGSSSSEGESDLEHASLSGTEEDGLSPKQPKKRRRVDDKIIDAGTKAASRKPNTIKNGGEKGASVSASGEETMSRSGADDEEEMTEEERLRLQQEAEAAWAKVRSRKEKGEAVPAAASVAQPSSASSSSSKAPKGAAASLNSWLGLPAIPWPTSPEAARVSDRDSLFIGFVYPITSSTPSTLAQHLNHLSTVVHPTLPASIFPDMLSHLDPKRRGSSHDIQAWRVLELKRGRDGLAGPNDFGLEEGQDDDGERWGGEKVLRVMKEMGAVDVFVVVSRWYGGTNLGPVRFDHIALCAREAIRAYMLEETLVPLRKELQALDAEIATLRAQIASGASTGTPASTQGEAERVASYADLIDAEKGERLVNARKKTVGMLQKRVQSLAASVPAPVAIPAQEATQNEAAASSDLVGAHGGSAAPEKPGDGSTTVEVAEPEGDEADVLQGWDDLA